MSIASSPVDWATLNAALGPALRRCPPGSTPATRLRRVVTAGLAAGIPPATIRTWTTRIARTDHPDVATLAATNATWHRTIASCRSRLATLARAGGRRRIALAVARRVVGHVLGDTPLFLRPTSGGVDPVPLSAHRSLQARRALAAIGVDVVRTAGADDHPQSGFDTALLTKPRVAAMLGVSVASAGRLMADLEGLSWLRRVSTRPGGGVRYRLGRLTASESDRLWEYAPVVDGVLGVLHGDDAGDTGVSADADLAVQWMLHAGHPAVSYGPDGVRLWAVGLADSLGIDPVGLGVPKRAVPGIRRQLADWGVARDVDVDLGAVLDRAAAETGADQRARDAAEQHRRQAAERVREVERVKELRARVRPALDAVLLAVTPRNRRGGTPKKSRVPDGAAPGEVKKAWWLRVRAALSQTELVHDPAALAEFRTLLVRRLVRDGWDKSKARAVAERVLVPTGERAGAA